MKRREFITILGGATVAWPFTAGAQQSRERRIGLLMSTPDDPLGQAWFAAFRQGLQQLGWEAGRNMQIDLRWGAGDTERWSQRRGSDATAAAPR
jgi:putative ABC transport system substrate-binding protein